MAFKTHLFCFFLAVWLVVLVSARPQDFDDEDDHDYNPAPSHHAAPAGRVQIKVYRGPTTHEGHAPWGFWVKQPADDGN